MNHKNKETCPVCSKEFPAGGTISFPKKYCSRKCKDRASYARRDKSKDTRRRREKRAKELGLTYEQFEAQGFRKKPNPRKPKTQEEWNQQGVWGESGIPKPPKEATNKEKQDARNLALRTIKYNKIKKFFEENKHEIVMGLLIWVKSKRLKENKKSQIYYQKHITKERERRRMYDALPESKEIKRELERKRQLEHPESYRASAAKYRALKKQAILPTTDDKEIEKFYSLAKNKMKETEIPHEVDHKIPLDIGGAHHQDNLQVLTEEENRSKSYNFDPKIGGVWANTDLARANQMHLRLGLPLVRSRDLQAKIYAN